eukprot:10089938-Karenia_brevis.AAC.1
MPSLAQMNSQKANIQKFGFVEGGFVEQKSAANKLMYKVTKLDEQSATLTPLGVLAHANQSSTSLDSKIVALSELKIGWK